MFPCKICEEKYDEVTFVVIKGKEELTVTICDGCLESLQSRKDSK